jgi:hypothetical protein
MLAGISPNVFAFTNLRRRVSAASASPSLIPLLLKMLLLHGGPRASARRVYLQYPLMGALFLFIRIVSLTKYHRGLMVLMRLVLQDQLVFDID